MVSQQQEQDERLFTRVIEGLPNMVFLKHAEAELREDYDRGFKYGYFNAAMDYESGHRRTDMIGQNAKDHFPTHFKRYFEDDAKVMALQADSTDVYELYEPWKVPKGDKVCHTRKCNLMDKYMLGTFIVAGEVHTGKVRDRRRQAPVSSSPMPAAPEPGIFTRMFDGLPVPVMISLQGVSPRVVTNRAYEKAFTEDDDKILLSMDAVSRADQVWEQSHAQLGREGLFHILQRPLMGNDGQVDVIVYVVWPMGDEEKVAEAHRAHSH